MKQLLVTLLAAASLSAAQAKQTFTGTISDDMCAGTAHKAMRMDPDDAECARLCVMLHDSEFVLEEGKNIYILSDRAAAEKFAAKKVRVVGRLDAKTKKIAVESIVAAS
jgi:hypothetical protein